MHFLASAERGFAQLAELVRLGAYAWLLSRLLSPYVRRNNAVQTALAAARRALSAVLSKQKAPHADDAAAKGARRPGPRRARSRYLDDDPEARDVAGLSCQMLVTHVSPE